MFKLGERFNSSAKLEEKVLQYEQENFVNQEIQEQLKQLILKKS